MKEVLYTIPLNDAFKADTECPFCYIEDKLEQDTLDFVLGSCSSYMEADVRATTDEEGFCRAHFKKMYAYGNTLGNAWILKTHYMKMRKELDENIKRFSKNKVSIKDRLFNPASPKNNSMSQWIKDKEKSCYICKRLDETFSRYVATFFHMYKNDHDFINTVNNSKGFCLSHFGVLCEEADKYLSDKEKDEFFPMMFALMKDNMSRLQEDVNWLVEKFNYQNENEPWKNSRDAVQRGMQKLKGGIYG